jgi:hypothetical protein
MGLEVGFFGLIILILNIWAIIKIFNSSASAGAKAIWIAVILVLPVLGFLLWLLFGPKS